ncbi:TPA: hypothetical protein QHK14_003561 [Klebsiella pneumoniae]|uniref:hypothetical protein n=1 Tax=Klebsiella pneumoniae complex TaxID=3390273 RepID=UPI0010824877|nr:MULTISPECIES: hypothetical protein [Klebsiella]ELQ4519196.1 hypothetical protein [Klebsiella pneumoniae]MBC4547111.1 hypothetical protein [Klebsiella pneumoniae]MBG1739517.1 hypothetical protein [Klebsiella pneumoniae]MCP5903505.1 hypothetical protein [Klebsiella pneumoniae]MCP5966009.1 hypothetical protein [Klebsiella pneumoniae]
MQTQVKIHGSNANYFFASIEVSQRASNGGLVVVRDVKIPITSTTHQLLNNYARGQVLTLDQKNGEVIDVYFIENDETNYVFSSHP